MHVLSVIDSLAFGGAERSLVELAPGLAGAGCRLTVAVLEDRPGYRAELEASGTPVVVLEATGRAGRARQVRSLIERLDVDLVHTSLFEADVAGRLAGAVARRPVVTTLTSVRYGADQFAEPGLSAPRLRAAQALDVATARTVRRFHAVSTTVADTMAARLRIARDRVVVVPRGRDPHRLGRRHAGRRQRVRKALGVPPEQPLVVSVARQEHNKGLDVLVDAAAVLRATGPDVTVVVAGARGRASAALEAQIEVGGLGRTVRLLGPREDVADLLCAADVFVLASRREGFPGAVVEAMALEAPLVLSDLPMMREVVGDPADARFAALGQPAELARAIAESLGDPDDARRRATRARARFESELTVEATGRRMAALFSDALRR
jgi:glycosyltransferase involved in cell wall biosynthesis